MVEMARKAVLHDANQTDPELSEAGTSQACDTREEMKSLASGPWNFPPPAKVFVSPLRRTLQTAAAVFPDHESVHVHGLVRERDTGLACDQQSPQWKMARTPAFSHMDFGQVLEEEARTEEGAAGASSLLGGGRRGTADP